MSPRRRLMKGEECFDIGNDRLLLRVRVKPGASKNEVLGVREGELLVRVAAAAEKGRANRELVRYLAGLLGVPRSSVALLAGEASRHKRLSLDRGALQGLQGLIRRAARG